MSALLRLALVHPYGEAQKPSHDELLDAGLVAEEAVFQGSIVRLTEAGVRAAEEECPGLFARSGREGQVRMMRDRVTVSTAALLALSVGFPDVASDEELITMAFFRSESAASALERLELRHATKSMSRSEAAYYLQRMVTEIVTSLATGTRDMPVLALVGRICRELRTSETVTVETLVKRECSKERAERSYAYLVGQVPRWASFVLEGLPRPRRM